MHFLPPIADGEDKTCLLANCLRNNYRHIKKWATKKLITCFRLYSREIKQFPLAIDFYAGRFCIHYYASLKAGEFPAEELKQQVHHALKIVFGSCFDDHLVYWRIRSKHKEERQYQKQSDLKEFFCVIEYGAKFKVNLTDYLDTGLFLDHRETRKYVASLATQKNVLNLFSYTCSFSVHAALAGAISTTNVDLSNTYLLWGKENFALNEISLRNHRFIREDCFRFLKEEALSNRRYDLIIIDPPTMSRSKKMTHFLNLQEDYNLLIHQAFCLLNKNGKIIFSTNCRNFKFDLLLFPGKKVKEISHLTLPSDFADKKTHQCWEIENLSAGKSDA